VTSATQLIGHELEETVEATPVEESDPEAIVAEIERLLDEIVETYQEGDAEAAAELAADAYLENYEIIEAEVIELAPKVNEELEPLLGADLRKQIREEARVEDVEQVVVRAKELLADALRAIEEQ
jgi:molybdenum-dependent DNA-binding transcriptional regulator ModE